MSEITTSPTEPERRAREGLVTTVTAPTWMWVAALVVYVVTLTTAVVLWLA